MVTLRRESAITTDSESKREQDKTRAHLVHFTEERVSICMGTTTQLRTKGRVA
jgi:hypothetical protein